MANEQITPQLDANLTPAQIYERHASLIYCMLRFFLTETATNEAIKTIAQQMLSVLPESGYSKYSHYVAYHLVYKYLANHYQSETTQKNDFPPPFKIFSFDEYFPLVLRDKFQFSCREISSILGIAEGSIRTRLDRIREKAFHKAEKSSPTRVTPDDHICLQVKEKIEDWNLTSARLGQFTAPSSLNSMASGCLKCLNSLKSRLASLSFFNDQPLYEIPARLLEFPVTPLFTKKKNRVHLNWNAAPWYLKALFEGLLATSLVFGIVISIPKIKNAYEFWQERRIDLYSLAELASNLGNSQDSQSESNTSSTGNTADAAPSSARMATQPGAPLNTSSDVALPPPLLSAQSFVGPLPSGSKIGEKLLVKPDSEFKGRSVESIGPDQLLRVLVKTDSPESVKDQVIQLLQAAQYTSANPLNANGSVLPGGIMFDVFVPTSNYKSLYNSLIGLGIEQPKFILTRNKERGIAGKARVKIWLQRI